MRASCNITRRNQEKQVFLFNSVKELRFGVQQNSQDMAIDWMQQQQHQIKGDKVVRSKATKQQAFIGQITAT